jgi:hypothetical protein
MKRVGKNPDPLSLRPFPGDAQILLFFSWCYRASVRLVDLLDLAARDLVDGVCEDLVLLARQPCLGNESVLIGSTSPERLRRQDDPAH